mmetsp:Transcript_7470/g.10512  ORF Transcript_7470/g.10512 Transcript_7470/m.10512 type:complete len:83 (+) Transcript_7470:91-339(+)
MEDDNILQMASTSHITTVLAMEIVMAEVFATRTQAARVAQATLDPDADQHVLVELETHVLVERTAAPAIRREIVLARLDTMG